VNNSTSLAKDVTGGVNNQATDIGEVIGIAVLVTILIGLVVLVLGIIFFIFNWIKNVRSKSKGMVR
jgi:Mn2+/Fe2+ NRAMP family transporter